MNKAIFEGADYFLDMEVTIPNKKRRRGEAFEYADSRCDEDYMSFLGNLKEVFEAKFVEEDNDDDDDDADADADDDPSYKEFLENLKEYGNAYMCDVSIAHGILFPIIYEVENDSTDENRRRTPKSRRETPKAGRADCVREDRSLDVDGNQSRGPKVSGSKKKISGDVDENYKVFIDSLQITKDSVFSQYGNKRVYYECSDQQTTDVETEPLETDGGLPTLTRKSPAPTRRPPTPPSREEFTTQRKQTSTDSHKTHNRLSTRPPTLTQRPPASLVRSPIQPSREESTTQREQTPTDGHNMLSKRQRTLTKRPPAPLPKSSTPPSREEFTTQRRKSPADGHNMLRIRPHILTKRPPAPLLRPTPPSREEFTTPRKQTLTNGRNMLRASNESCKNREQSPERFAKYWQKLFLYLKKPYDQKELDDLEGLLCTRKRVSIHRESRTGGTSRPGKMGKSLVEQYPDLNDEIRKAQRDRGKVLNLLRMLNFFMQKVPAGVPEPWKDAHAMSIFPGSS